MYEKSAISWAKKSCEAAESAESAVLRMEWSEPMSFSLGGKKVPYFTSYDFKEQALRNFWEKGVKKKKKSLSKKNFEYDK